MGERSAGALRIVKSSAMMGFTPNAVERLLLARYLGIVQLSDDEAANPSANRVTTGVFIGVDLVVFGREETSMKTKTLRHVSSDTDVHPRLVVDSAALRNTLGPGSE